MDRTKIFALFLVAVALAASVVFCQDDGGGEGGGDGGGGGGGGEGGGGGGENGGGEGGGGGGESNNNGDEGASGGGGDQQNSTANKYTTDPDSCPETAFTNTEDRNACCKKLNAKRANFTDCCIYPILVIWRWQYNLCVEQGTAGGQELSRCNLLSCCLQYLTIIDDDVPNNNMTQQGFHYSFLLSVGNNTAWDTVVAGTMETCFRLSYVHWSVMTTDKESDEYKNYWDCFERIPKCFYNILDCAYDYNYYNCPDGIFKEEITGCPISKQYVKDCFIGGGASS